MGEEIGSGRDATGVSDSLADRDGELCSCWSSSWLTGHGAAGVAVGMGLLAVGAA